MKKVSIYFNSRKINKTGREIYLNPDIFSVQNWIIWKHVNSRQKDHIQMYRQCPSFSKNFPNSV